jgi:FkbM family methyltransferase
MNNIFHSIRYRSLLLMELKRSMFMKLTNKTFLGFIKGGDIISQNLQLAGVHESVITSLIASWAKNGYNNFLLDIGANIGLTSCQNGNEFSEIHMFEPNPLCQHILEVNTALMLTKPTITIHRFALGQEDKKARLMVPRYNWGGGYIDDHINSYDRNTLIGKDGFYEYNIENYLSFDINIQNTKKILTSVFADLVIKGLTKGVIKIDIEGYEPIAIKGIAQSLPNEMECYIVFESFNEFLDISEILNQFNGRAKAYKVLEVKPWKQKWPKLLKLIFSFFNDKISWKVDYNISDNWKGDIILHIQAI